ncbi:ATP-BINDING CASSETTE TRANSPORTER [Salix viminalis]|uniref:ATP-BINDING CASSETTE TRANSPORTER n=1 Tax=Salix viminalis TaxID=40686 RepID=A0A9Q0UFU2_SALVM|nr:ATP-BINDING CASSETTE TRANSPORTER [Salix viminalis]
MVFHQDIFSLFRRWSLKGIKDSTGIISNLIVMFLSIHLFFYQFFLLFLVHQVSISMFRLIASIVRNPSIASTCALFIILITFLFGGFVIRKPSLPSWLRWGFWLSPLAYAEIGASLKRIPCSKVAKGFIFQYYIRSANSRKPGTILQ